ncbi:unnamed protein product [Amoebophrya sp. A25]|nr:unnamed protein product [Amoebophrya sp. A25]|eukprot:GSA25T00006327001.1
MARSGAVEQQLVVSLAEEVRDLKATVKSLEARLEQQQEKFQTVPSGSQWTNLVTRFEKHASPLLDRLSKEMGERVLKDDFTALEKRVKLCERDLSLKADADAMSNVSQLVAQFRNAIGGKASQDAVQMLQQSVAEQRDSLKEKAAAHRVEQIQNVLDTLVEQSKSRYASAVDMDSVLQRLPAVEHDLQQKPDLAEFRDIASRVMQTETALLSKYSNAEGRNLAQTVANLEVVVGTTSGLSPQTIASIENRLEQAEASLNGKVNVDELLQVNNRTTAVERSLFWKAGSVEVHNLAKRMLCAEVEVAGKAEKSVVESAQNRLEMVEEEVAAKARSSDLATLTERCAFLELQLPEKANMEEIAVHRSRLNMLELDLVGKANKGDVNVVQDNCLLLTDAINDRALLSEVSALREQIDMNAEGLISERAKSRDENLLLHRDLFRLQRQIREKPDFASLPIGPNLLRDTKKFSGLCKGLLNTELSWTSGGLGGDWSGFLWKKHNPAPTRGDLCDGLYGSGVLKCYPGSFGTSSSSGGTKSSSSGSGHEHKHHHHHGDSSREGGGGLLGDTSGVIRGGASSSSLASGSSIPGMRVDCKVQVVKVTFASASGNMLQRGGGSSGGGGSSSPTKKASAGAPSQTLNSTMGSTNKGGSGASIKACCNSPYQDSAASAISSGVAALLGELGEHFVNPETSEDDQNSFAGSDLNCVIIDVKILDDAGGQGGLAILCQSHPLFTSYNRGSFRTQVSVFCNVLEHSGDTELYLFNGRGAGVRVSGRAKNMGWRHYHSSQKGFGDNETSSFVGKGRMRVAIALPYVGHGYHGGVPVWSGFISDYYAQDTKALTTAVGGG